VGNQEDDVDAPFLAIVEELFGVVYLQSVDEEHHFVGVIKLSRACGGVSVFGGLSFDNSRINELYWRNLLSTRLHPFEPA
jgi:hypothetical protein